MLVLCRTTKKSGWELYQCLLPEHLITFLFSAISSWLAWSNYWNTKFKLESFQFVFPNVLFEEYMWIKARSSIETFSKMSKWIELNISNNNFKAEGRRKNKRGKNAAQRSRQHARIQWRLSSNERTHTRGGHTHSVINWAYTQRGGRTHNVTQQTDTHIFTGEGGRTQ